MTQQSPTGSEPSAPANPTPASVTPNYARRRLIRNLLGIGLVTGGLAFFAGPGLTMILSDNPAPQVAAGPALAAPAAPGTADKTKGTILDRQIDNALAHLAEHGSLDAWQPTRKDVHAVAMGTGAVLSMTVDGRCLMGGILNGTPMAVDVDPSGAACTMAELDAARTQMSGGSASEGMARQMLTPAVDTALFWSTSTFVNGSPSFIGMPAEIIPGVSSTVSKGGTTVLLQSRHGGACVALKLTLQGDTRDVPCS